MLDRARAKSHLFPALHPNASLSSLRTMDGVGRRHVELAERAQRLLGIYESTDPAYALVQADQVPADAELASAQRLLRYLSQPFHITEPFTGRAGEFVGCARMLDEVEALLGEV